MTDFLNQFSITLPNWLMTKTILLSNIQWVLLVLVFILSFILEKVCRNLLLNKALLFADRFGIPLKEEQQKKINLPLAIILLSLFIYIGIQFLGLPQSIHLFLIKATRVSLTFGGIYAVYNLVDLLGIYFEKVAEKSENKIDDILVPLLQKSLKFFIVAIGIVFIGDSLALDMKSVIAGLGIGGLAFAFAAKDTLANFFGSLMIVLDRPFGIGDWVSVGSSIEGTVIEVGLRSTRLRTSYDSIISVPNAEITNKHIDNYGRRNYRRFRTHLGVQYDTPHDKLEAFCEGIKKIILEHKYTRKDYFHVSFDNFGASSLDILLNVFWKVDDITMELEQKHILLMDILKLGNEMGVQFAFPTQTVHLVSEIKK